MPRTSKLSIQTLMGALISALCLLLLALCVQDIVVAGKRLVDMRRLATLSTISEPLIKSLGATRLERGTILATLAGEGPINNASENRIATQRPIVDAGQADAVRKLEAAPDAVAKPVLEKLKATYQGYQDLRAKAEVAMRQPLAARDQAVIRDAPKLSLDYLDAVAAASDHIDSVLQMVDPSVDQLLKAKRAAMTMRVTAGQAMLHTNVATAAKRGWTKSELHDATEMRGRYLMAWSAITEVSSQPGAPKELVDATAKAKEIAMGYIQGAHKTYVEALSNGAPPSASLADLQSGNSVALGAIEAVAIAAARATEARADAMLSDATGALLFSSAVLILALVLTGVGFWVVQRRICRPIKDLTGSMTRLAARDFSGEAPFAERGDEIGEMARTLKVFKDNMIAADRMAEAQAAEQAVKSARVSRLDQLNADFDRSARAALDALAQAASEVRSTASGMSESSKTAAERTVAATTASEQASLRVQTVASATEQLSASIQEISLQVSESSVVAGQAVEEVVETNGTMRNLSEAAQKIGDVVNLINSIAGQTNLLALNATIEAARAGEAGKGFAVVAGEVKNLATQTARATQEIIAQVSSMQNTTAAAVSAISRIDHTISRMNEISASIAAAMEEQGAATQEIARNLQEAAAGASDMSNNVGGVNAVVERTGDASQRMFGAADQLSRQTEALKGEVSAFLGAIRAA
ncbi:MAG: methyl-accepting chemotaxis protein [Elsteraceae bacterium]